MGTRTKNILKYLFLPKYHYAEMTKKDKWWLTGLIYMLTGYYLAYQWRKYRDMPDNFTHRFLVNRDLYRMSIEEILQELATARQVHDLAYIEQITQALELRNVTLMNINEITKALKNLEEDDIFRLHQMWQMTNEHLLTQFELDIRKAVETEMDNRLPF